MDIKQLKYLIALDQTRHFGQAAAACHITQPTLSMRIRNLEEELNLTLIQRGQRFEGFTPEGERILAWARAVLAAHDGLAAEAAICRGQMVGQLRVGMVPLASLNPMQLIKPLAEKYPALQFSLLSMTSEQIIDGVSRNQLDLGICYLQHLDEGQFTIARLPQTRMGLLHDKRHFDFSAGTPGWETLATLPLGQDVMVWLGHSSWYLQLAGKRILIDPVFSDYAAPFSFINKAFPGDYPWRAEGMPEIDLLIISHDHYDHLDYATIRALLPKIKRVITPLGVGSHLRYWGMDGALITEADWQQAVPASDELTVHVLPARHFSGRGLKRNQTLWASFLFVTRQQKIYYSGDSGYGPHFKAIGNEFGPVDLAIMENGQYDQDWKYIHMMPDETAQAADDLRARAVLPGHAGRFVLAKHSWDEPYQRLAAASEGRAWRLLTPVQGEPVWVADKTQSFNAWWR
ncbi:TPA: LysR family transcriptional regulator [Klebsiella pneumoniae]|nr:LysR family transcriptional regulator [Klebsiella pneumoniae]